MHGSKRARTVVLAVACVALGATFGPTLATAASEKITDVFVTNDDANPVPTKAIGTTAVTGTVGITGTPSVNVANTTPIPVAPVAGPGATPIAQQISFGFTGAGGSTFDTFTYNVPAGKRLTIDLVTFSDLQRAVGVEQFTINALTGGNGTVHWVATEDTPGAGDTVTRLVPIVADPGSSLVFGVQLTSPLGSENTTLFMHGSFTGTLTDA